MLKHSQLLHFFHESRNLLCVKRRQLPDRIGARKGRKLLCIAAALGFVFMIIIGDQQCDDIVIVIVTDFQSNKEFFPDILLQRLFGKNLLDMLLTHIIWRSLTLKISRIVTFHCLDQLRAVKLDQTREIVRSPENR